MILQLLVEVYRPVLFFTPEYAVDKAYLYSYKSNLIAYSSNISSILSPSCLPDERDFFLQLYVREEGELQRLLSQKRLSSDWIWTASVEGYPSITDFYIHLMSSYMLFVIRREVSCHGYYPESTYPSLFLSTYYAIRLLFISYLHLPLESVCIPTSYSLGHHFQSVL